MQTIQLENMGKNFGNRRIFAHYNLSVNEGEMVAITGSSGAGKTTLLNIIGLVEPFNTGRLSIFGKGNIRPNSIKANRVIRQDICYLFQNFALVDNETVKENIEMALKFVKADARKKSRLISDALKEVGLSGYENTKIFALSGGEQQRVSIARILVNPKKLILADEPTGSLDAKNRDAIMSFLKEFNKSGKTVIIVTHDQSVAQQCERNINLERQG